MVVVVVVGLLASKVLSTVSGMFGLKVLILGGRLVLVDEGFATGFLIVVGGLTAAAAIDGWLLIVMGIMLEVGWYRGTCCNIWLIALMSTLTIVVTSA